MDKTKYWVVGAGIATGLAALLLTAAGNPANMGFCIACFIRDIAGGFGLHSADKQIRCSTCVPRSSVWCSVPWQPHSPGGNSAPAPDHRPPCGLCSA